MDNGSTTLLSYFTKSFLPRLVDRPQKSDILLTMSNEQKCPDPRVDENGQGWLGRQPTEDERSIAKFLVNYSDQFSAILHVGVGNSLLFQLLGKKVKQGITIDGKEANHSRTMGLPTILANKYAIPFYHAQLAQPFDCIVDVNIRSYSCCDHHFAEYMELMRSCLTPRGILLTSPAGLAYRQPTTLKQLSELCKTWTIGLKHNTIIMLPGRTLKQTLRLATCWR